MGAGVSHQNKREAREGARNKQCLLRGGAGVASAQQLLAIITVVTPVYVIAYHITYHRCPSWTATVFCFFFPLLFTHETRLQALGEGDFLFSLDLFRFPSPEPGAVGMWPSSARCWRRTSWGRKCGAWSRNTGMCFQFFLDQGGRKRKCQEREVEIHMCTYIVKMF